MHMPNLKTIYKNLKPNQKTKFKKAFCIDFDCSDQTFRRRLDSGFQAIPAESKWVLNYFNEHQDVLRQHRAFTLYMQHLNTSKEQNTEVSGVTSLSAEISKTESIINDLEVLIERLSKGE